MQPHFEFDIFHNKRVHVGITGSISAFKMVMVLRTLIKFGIHTSCTLTKSAHQFVTPLSFHALGVDPVYSELFNPLDDPFSHLAPSRTAQCQVICPATANFIAKMAHGIADDMLSCQTLAFPHQQIIAPAMNSMMWSSKPVQQNIQVLASRNISILSPREGLLACGDTGHGKLADENDIFLAILHALSPHDLSGKRVLVCLGPTHEYFDVARYWSNPSTGLMGACLAIAAWFRGADVHVVQGPCTFFFPESITITPVTTAHQMYEAMVSEFPKFDIICMAAAVADFSPVPYSQSKNKFKRDITGKTAPHIEFISNPDILAKLGYIKSQNQKLIGFCAETSELKMHAEEKLLRKQCDIMVANFIGRDNSGFSSTTNDVEVVDKHGRYEKWPVLPKPEVAWRILDWTNHV
ncbi:bifunctional phosphopantothenoylcysteine decarboxylase/phosphopantothenate--cysteine ligase CoaBC [Desulfolutivibrio sp.]|uniref:bifunctional phosphopantothenoylcysteine decarboxylase/phosphopantothenate--cysteine ligase CoaBC n=1 Tax=Desulfolutivibrio sp. TaxID=2773296 RepID=UPI002F96316B